MYKTRPKNPFGANPATSLADETNVVRTQTNLAAKSKSTSPTKDRLRDIAIKALVAVAKDVHAPSAARAAAARTLLETIGDIGRLQEVSKPGDKNLTELTPEEIDQELERLKPIA